MGYSPLSIQEARGHSGGIWALGKDNSDIHGRVVESHPQAITIQLSSNGLTWCCTGVYGHPVPRVRENLWVHLQALRNNISVPWLLLGDFNDILAPSEQRGGSFSVARASVFAQHMDNCGLMNIPLEKWIKLGNKNTAFFHTQTVVRRKRNRILGLHLPSGAWCTDGNLLKQEALAYFKSLLGASEAMPQVLPPCPISLSMEEQASLEAPVSKAEVFDALRGMKSFKAPGPDGFQPIFYKQYWHMIGDDVWRFVASAFENGRIDAHATETLLVLIPKGDHPRTFKDFRPISLCNVVYKLVSKVLVNRLRPFLMRIVSPFQSSFIPGRGTMDNAIILQEIIHTLSKSKKKTGDVIFKLDLEKAYDRVDWRFLQEVLTDCLDWNGSFQNGHCELNSTPERAVPILEWAVPILKRVVLDEPARAVLMQHRYVAEKCVISSIITITVRCRCGQGRNSNIAAATRVAVRNLKP
uniref:Transposon TX1 uncharacterized n=1 Tax=Cajanus cajan TaxID=3821 RepID=A0A151UAA5_CAJCA|nr:Transposon TX1 uncharacterized [Cajanus cajan]